MFSDSWLGSNVRSSPIEHHWTGCTSKKTGPFPAPTSNFGRKKLFGDKGGLDHLPKESWPISQLITLENCLFITSSWRRNINWAINMEWLLKVKLKSLYIYTTLVCFKMYQPGVFWKLCPNPDSQEGFTKPSNCPQLQDPARIHSHPCGNHNLGHRRIRNESCPPPNLQVFFQTEIRKSYQTILVWWSSSGKKRWSCWPGKQFVRSGLAIPYSTLLVQICMEIPCLLFFSNGRGQKRFGCGCSCKRRQKGRIRNRWWVVRGWVIFIFFELASWNRCTHQTIVLWNGAA